MGGECIHRRSRLRCYIALTSPKKNIGEGLGVDVAKGMKLNLYFGLFFWCRWVSPFCIIWFISYIPYIYLYNIYHCPSNYYSIPPSQNQRPTSFWLYVWREHLSFYSQISVLISAVVLFIVFITYSYNTSYLTLPLHMAPSNQIANMSKFHLGSVSLGKLSTFLN